MRARSVSSDSPSRRLMTYSGRTRVISTSVRPVEFAVKGLAVAGEEVMDRHVVGEEVAKMQRMAVVDLARCAILPNESYCC